MYKEYSTDNELSEACFELPRHGESVPHHSHSHQDKLTFPSNSNCLRQTGLQLIMSP